MSTVETPPSHTEAANAIIAQLRTALQSISGFGFVTRGQRRRLAPSATVSDSFFLTVALAVETMPEIATAAKLQAADLRDLVNFSNAYESLASEFELAARGLRETIATRRSDFGVRALRAYKMAQAYDRPTDRELLAPHLREMKRTLGRGRPRKMPERPPDTAPAAPAAPSAPVN